MQIAEQMGWLGWPYYKSQWVGGSVSASSCRTPAQVASCDSCHRCHPPGRPLSPPCPVSHPVTGGRAQSPPLVHHVHPAQPPLVQHVQCPPNPHLSTLSTQGDPHLGLSHYLEIWLVERRIEEQFQITIWWWDEQACLHLSISGQTKNLLIRVKNESVLFSSMFQK